MKASGNLILELLRSLARVNGIGFQIWGSDGVLLFASDPRLREVGRLHETEAFSRRVVARGGFVHTAYRDGHQLFGVPLSPGRYAGCLLALKAADRRTGGAPEEAGTQAARMREFLDRLREVMLQDAGIPRTGKSSTPWPGQDLSADRTFCETAWEPQTAPFDRETAQSLARDLFESTSADMAAFTFPERSDCNAFVTADSVREKVSDPELFVREAVDKAVRFVSPGGGNCLMVNNSHDIAEFRDMAWAPFRLMCVSVEHGNERCGWLVIVSFNMRQTFRRSECLLLSTVGRLVAMALATANLHPDLAGILADRNAMRIHEA
jgi:hypothetical protein